MGKVGGGGHIVKSLPSASETSAPVKIFWIRAWAVLFPVGSGLPGTGTKYSSE